MHSFHSYASARIEKLRAEGQLRQRSRLLKWTPITVAELEGFLALVINMGIITAPAVEDYWKTSWIAEIPFFSRVMSRDHFELIFWMLHVSHSTVSPAKRIDKIKMLLEMMLAKFQANYIPKRSLAVDETMTAFRGRFSGKQYMPKKLVKWGIKAFSLADSSNSYLLNILLYTDSETLDEASQQFSSLPQPARVVLHLLEPYLHMGHHVFTDRYYTSIPLAQALHDNETAFTGTSVRGRVDLPDSIRAGQTPKQGEVMAYRHDHLMALMWHAEKKKVPVVMLSTECSAWMIIVPSRRPGVAEQEKPTAVHTYNQDMNDVDIAYQYTATYPFTRKTIKWWRKVLFWLMDLCITNSYALYRELEQNRILPHIAYRRSIVATRYNTSAPPRPRIGRPRKSRIQMLGILSDWTVGSTSWASTSSWNVLCAAIVQVVDDTELSTIVKPAQTTPAFAQTAASNDTILFESTDCIRQPPLYNLFHNHTIICTNDIRPWPASMK